MKHSIICLKPLMVVIFMVGVYGKAMAQQAFANSVVKVRNFPVIVFAGDNVHNFPQRGPVLVSEDDVTGVYNETAQTMTLTYHFTSDSTVVSIYRDFNKMLQDSISVTNGTEIAYNLSGYGQGDFIFDIRRPRNDSVMVSVGDLSLIGQGTAGGSVGYIGMYEQYLGQELSGVSSLFGEWR